MEITELLLAELDREAVGIRKTLERVPEGKNDCKPHELSMPLGYLATIVATIPAWLDMGVNMDELDINPPGVPKFKPQEWKTRQDLLEQFEASLKKGREVLQGTTDESPAEHEVANASRWQVDERADTLCRHPRRHAQPHGASPWTTDSVPVAEPREGPRNLRSISG